MGDGAMYLSSYENYEILMKLSKNDKDKKFGE